LTASKDVVVVVVEHAQSLEMNCRPGVKQSRFALKHFDFCFVLKFLNNFSFHAGECVSV